MSAVPRVRFSMGIFLLVCLILSGCTSSINTTGSANNTLQASTPTKDVIANLFEWNWTSIANECTTVLGPAGYGGVQVAPPQDSLSRQASAGTPIHPWWEVYQPVDYNLTSRMGNEDQFKSMVATCRKAGVKVYVDAVLNHMTGQGDISYGSVHYSKYDYPNLYTYADFHHAPADCPSSDGNVDDFNDYTQVTKCELDSLADLRTESDKVRDTLADYLNKLLSYGVSGFRIDSAKHIGEPDLTAIESKLNKTVDGTRPYIALEVQFGGSGQLAPESFEGEGSLLGFDFADQIEADFKSDPQTQEPSSSIAQLQNVDVSGLLPSDKSLVFVENHDTERNDSTLNYKDGATNTIATEFMLAYGYGTPEVYASFSWNTSDDSPPSDTSGYVTNTNCNKGWVCQDRFTGIANMVGWHNYVGSAARANWYDDGANLIAFSRSNKGWISINNATSAHTMSFTTGLAAGTYCDIIHGSASHGTCSGPTITVGSDGKASVTVPAKDAVAIDGAEKVG